MKNRGLSRIFFHWVPYRLLIFDQIFDGDTALSRLNAYRYRETAVNELISAKY